MARSTSSVAVANITAGSRERVAAENRAAKLEQTRLAGAYDIVEAQVQENARAIAALYKERAKRGSQLTTAITKYLGSRDANSVAQRMRAFVDLYRAQNDTGFKLADATVDVNESLLDSYLKEVPEYQRDRKSARNPEVAKKLWEAFFRNAKGKENVGPMWDALERKAGPFESLGIAENEPIYASYNEFKNAKDTYEKNFRASEAKRQGFIEDFDSWAKQQGFDLTNETSRQNAIDKYISEKQIRAEDIPQPSAPFINTLEQYAKDPAKYKKYFGDIDESIAALKGEQASLLETLPSTEAEKPPASFNELLSAWISRPDVRDWAKDHGFNLGKLVPPDPETQKLIDAGQYPTEFLINGMMYQSSPDDVRAMELAYKHMGYDPKKSLEYAAEQVGDDSVRTLVDVSVVVPPPNIVETATLADGTPVAKLDNGFYVKEVDNKLTYFALEDGDPETLWENAKDKNVLDKPVQAELPPKTEWRTLYKTGNIYQMDPPGSIRGVDPETGKMVVLKKEEIAAVNYPGDGPIPRSEAERKLAEQAKAKMAEEGYDTAEPIGEKLTAGEKKAAEKAKTELIVPQREPDLAERVTRQRLDRQLEEANRLKALADEARAQGNPQKAARLDARYAEAKAKADRTRSEVDEMVRERRPGIPFVSESGYNEQLQPRGTGQGFQDEFFPEGLGKLRLSDQEKEDAAALAASKMSFETRSRKEELDSAVAEYNAAKDAGKDTTALTQKVSDAYAKYSAASSKDAEMAAEYAAWREAQRPETPGKFTQTPGSMPGEGVYLPREAARMPTVAPVEPMQPGEAPVEKSKGGASKPGKFSPLVSPDVSGEPPALPATETPQEKAYAIKSGVFSSQDAEAAMAGLNAPLMPLPTTPSQTPTAAPSLPAPVSAPPKAAQAAPVPSPRVPQKRPVGKSPAIGTKQAGQVPLEGFNWGSAPPAPPAKNAPVSAGATTSTPITPTASTSPQKAVFGATRRHLAKPDVEDEMGLPAQ